MQACTVRKEDRCVKDMGECTYYDTYAYLGYNGDRQCCKRESRQVYYGITVITHLITSCMPAVHICNLLQL